jgi:putative ABC transport system permease protein
VRAITAPSSVAAFFPGVALTRLLGNLLYKVSPRDPVAFACAFAVMAIVSVAACLLPAWRAARTDPMRALRMG